MAIRTGWRRGDPYVWLAGSGLGACLLLVGALLVVIAVNGLGFFWPGRLVEVTLEDGEVLLGELVGREVVPAPGGETGGAVRQRLQFKLGNRDVTGTDFRWVDEAAIRSMRYPEDAFYVERREYGPFIGTPVRLARGEAIVAEGASAVWAALQPLVDRAAADRRAIRRLERDELGPINAALERIRLEARRLDADRPGRPGAGQAEARARLAREAEALQRQYEAVEARLMELVEAASAVEATFRTAAGEERAIRTLDIFRIYPANRLSMLPRARVYASRVWEFLSADPRESNTEGGIFPAIFGTVMMVMLMSVVAVPLGVLAALYLREYARQGPFVRAVRIAVNNLAGVPSIVFGVFGLGFFVYGVGGVVDRTVFPERLPMPTFGTGGLLWASLTLALLTVPVVIVAAEEALAAVPRSVREASLALGATRFQTVRHVVLPAAAPGIMTGFILAMARGAGEVAPLMLTGVVKLAPDLPVDGVFPYIHLERKFMHLGFHIYDVGFQSPNIEAAKPMVYTTTLLLLAIVVALNVAAIVVRTRLRRRYRSGAF
jgi:phosphate transport system permease protein